MRGERVRGERVRGERVRGERVRGEEGEGRGGGTAGAEATHPDAKLTFWILSKGIRTWLDPQKLLSILRYFGVIHA